MKFHCHRRSLAAAFGIVGGVVPTRTPKEILQNIKLSVEGDTATLFGTDTEVSIVYSIGGVETIQPGQTLLPEARVSSILRELTGETITLTLEDDQLVIASDQSEFRLATVDPEGFSETPEFEEESYFKIPAHSLREAIRRTVFAADPESTRYALGGVLIEPAETGGLVFAATDGRRLAVCEVACETVGEPGAGPSDGAVVPSKALMLLERSLAGLEEDALARLALRPGGVLLESGQASIHSQLVDGRFPKYRQVIPAQSPIEIPMVAGEFHTAIKQAQILTSDESRGVDFTFEEGTLTLQSQSGSVGSSKIAMPIDYDGAELQITFDPKFVADVLRILDPTTSFSMFLTDGDTQVVLKIGSGYTYVIMPLSRDRHR